MELDVYGMIEKYSDLVFGIDAINAEKAALIDTILTPEIKEKLAEIDAEFGEKTDRISQEKSLLEAQIKDDVLIYGRTIKGTYFSFVYSKPRISYDSKALDVYAVSHPEITQFRSEGNPSVSVRKA